MNTTNRLTFGQHCLQMSVLREEYCLEKEFSWPVVGSPIHINTTELVHTKDLFLSVKDNISSK